MAIKISGSTIIDDGRSLVNVGVSTISGDLHVGTGVTIFSSTGIVSATAYYGDGSNLSGAGFNPDADENLVAGTSAGTNLDGTNACFNLFLGACAGQSVTVGANNIF